MWQLNVLFHIKCWNNNLNVTKQSFNDSKALLLTMCIYDNNLNVVCLDGSSLSFLWEHGHVFQLAWVWHIIAGLVLGQDLHQRSQLQPPLLLGNPVSGGETGRWNTWGKANTFLRNGIRHWPSWGDVKHWHKWEESGTESQRNEQVLLAVLNIIPNLAQKCCPSELKQK